MGSCFTHLWRGAFRPKTVDTSSSDLKQNLTLVDLVSVGLSGAVGVSGCLYMGVATQELAGPSVVLSVLIAAVISMLTGSVCAELGCRMPRSGGVYTYIYATLGELPALLVASCLLFDLCVIPALAARGMTEYVDAVTNHTVMALLRRKFPQVEGSLLLAPHFDLFAVIVVLIAVLLASFETKDVCQLGTICIGLSILILSAIAFTTLLRANIDNWTQGQGFFPSGLQGVVSGGALMGLAMGSWCQTGVMAGEAIKFSKITLTLNTALPMIILLLFFPMGAGITLNSPILSSTPYLTSLFPGASLLGMRILVAIGTGFGLWATVATSLIVASRLLNCLSRDNLAPSVFGRVNPIRGTPWPAALCCGVASALIAGVASTWLLLRIAGVGGFAAGVTGSLAVVARRYHPVPIHALEILPSRDPSLAEMQQLAMQCSSYSAIPWPSSDLSGTEDLEDEEEKDEAPKDVTVEWKKENWVSQLVEPQTPPSTTSARTTNFLLGTFLANSAVGAAVARAAGVLGRWWALGGAALCISGCLVSAGGVWLQPRHSPPSTYHSSPGMPLLPLAAALANTLLLFHLPLPALIAGIGVASLALLGWLVIGYKNSIEAILSRALLTRYPSFQGDSL